MSQAPARKRATLTRSIAAVVLALGVTHFVAPSASAATSTWDGGYGTTSTWNQASQWVGDIAFADNNDVVFNSVAGASSVNTFLGSDRIVNSITFDGAASGTDPAFNIALTTAGNGAAAANFTFRAGNTGITVNAQDSANHRIGTYGTGTGTFGNFVLAGGLTITHNGTGTLTIDRPITGAFSVVKSGAGTLILSAANTFSSTSRVTAGTLTLSNSLALQSSTFDATNSVTGSASEGLRTTVATLTLGGLNGSKDLASLFTTALGGSGGTTALGGYSGVTALTLNPGSGTATYSGAIADGATDMTLTKTGAGTQIVSGTNTYTGKTTISGGTLQFAKLVSLYNNNTAGTGWTAANIVVANTGTLAVNVGGTGEFTAGDVTTLLTDLGGLGGTGGSGTTGFAAGSFIGFDTSNAAGNTFTVADTIANSTGAGGGAIGVTKLGSNTLVLSSANSYTGVTTINAGTLSLSGGNNRLLSTSTVAFTGTSTFDIGSTSQTLAAITVPNGSSNSTINGSGGTLTINGASNLEWGQGGSIVNGTSTVVNLGGLSNFAFNGPSNTFRVAYKTGASNSSTAVTASSTVTLAASNTIAANSLAVGDIAASSHGGTSTLRLGAANILNVGSINVGFVGRSSATLDFAVGSSAVTIRNTNGSSAVSSWNVGLINNPNAVVFTDSVNLSNGTVDALVTSMTIGQANPVGTSRTGTTNASFIMGASTGEHLTVGTMNVGVFLGASGSTVTGTMAANGTFTLNSASGIVNVTTLNLATNTTLATGGTSRTVSGTFNLTDGTLNATTVQKGDQTGGTATATTAFNWTNGTISNISGGNLAIINTPITLFSGTHTFNISGNNTATLDANSTIGGGAFDITKSGTGTLTLSGASTYSGTTTVNAGTLLIGVGGVGSLASTAVQVGTGSANSGTLGGSGSIAGPVTINGGGKVAPGNSAGTLTTGAETWKGGGAYTWEIADPAGIAGTVGGWDLLQLGSNALTVDPSANSTTPFIINIARIGGATTSGPIDPDLWFTIAQVGSVTGFSADGFVLPDPGGGQQWEIQTVANGGGGFDVQVSPVPEPGSLGALAMAGIGLLSRRSRRRSQEAR